RYITYISYILYIIFINIFKRGALYMKSKKLIGKISLMLLTIAMFISVTACNDTALPPDEEGPEKEPIEYVDLSGYDFKILGYFRDGIAELAPEVGDSVLGDKLLEHYKTVGDLFNCTITAENANGQQVSRVQKAALSGTKEADVVDLWLNEALNLYKGDYLMTLNEIVEDPFIGKYGTGNQLLAATMKRPWGDDIYGFRAAYWGLPSPTFSLATYFNPKLIQNFEQPNPFELIEQKNWTWDTFEEICKGVISTGDDQSVDTDDTFGLPNDPALRYVPRAIMMSNGVKSAYYDEAQGMYVSGLNTPEALEALTWGRKLVENGCMKIISGTAANGVVGKAVETFMVGRAAFLVEYTYHGAVDKNSFSYTKDFEFAWIPFPIGPKSEWGNWSSTISFADRYLIIPKGGTDAEILSAVVPALFEPFEGMDNDDWRDLFANRIFFEDNSKKWFFEMYDNAQYDYFNTIAFFQDGEYTNQVLSGKKTPQQVLEEVEAKAQAEVDKNTNKYLWE
ncbi:MAG: transporter substrate-binding protein, partial [Clostridia bacterium]|nr:transporter substrate-binding protein [Clostridia bacterium]